MTNSGGVHIREFGLKMREKILYVSKCEQSCKNMGPTNKGGSPVSTFSLITVLTFTTFSIEPSSADRLGVTITLLLTSVTFKLIVKQSLPTISYLTYLDLYVIAALVFLGLTSAQHAIIRYMSIKYTEAQINQYDNYSIITLLGIFIAFHVIFAIYMRLTAIKRRTIMVEKDKIYKSKRKFINHFGENARTEKAIEQSMSKTRGGTRI
ncbi:unnamed protein product [Mytilus edulis]|uniref:Neurotransmitter-gated ion-channel transmembrane domain-containing protein n=1 Tax=Mytilus edulis TaxID=6550 RepID=A0A8S3U4P6_MYTED|nr:unnamed protein product [Mytilus edulis]